MKQSFFLLIFALFGVTTGFSQTSLKIGHINTQELLAAMPESDSAQAKIEKVYKDFQSQLEVMQVEFNSKYQDYIFSSVLSIKKAQK